MLQKFTCFAISITLIAPALAQPTQTTKKSISKPLPNKKIATKASIKKPILLSKIIARDSKTPIANVKGTPIPDVAPVNYGQHVIINIPQQRLFLYNDGILEKVYPVAVGKAMTQTNLGEHIIGSKSFDPTWHIPKSIQAQLKNGKTTVPPGPDNPLGPVFVRLGNPKLGLGIHGTNAPSSVPGVRSHGCVRMKSEQALDFAHTISSGSPATVSYEMAALNVDETNKLWLAVFTDPYNKKNLNIATLKKAIQAWAKDNDTTIASSTVDKIIKRKSGKPICLNCKGKATIKGNLQSLAWKNGSIKFTAPKSSARGMPSNVMPEEDNEIEVDATDDIQPIAKTKPSTTKATKNYAKKSSTSIENTNSLTSEVEQQLKPIAATSAFEQPLKPINSEHKSASAINK